jgi:hypothetical protein
LTTYDPNDGAAAGDYTVLVIKEAPAPTASSGPPAHGANAASTPAGMSHAGGRGKKAANTSSNSVLPEKYMDRGKSDLNATVTSGGENKFDFDLKP